MNALRVLILLFLFPVLRGQAQVFFNPMSSPNHSVPQKMQKIPSPRSQSANTGKNLDLNFKKEIQRSPAVVELGNLSPPPAPPPLEAPREHERAPLLRWNQMDLLVTIGSWSENAVSDFSPRQRSTGGMMALTRARVWWSQYWAVGMGLRGSWLADQSLSSGHRIAVQQESMEWSLTHRKQLRYGLWTGEIGYRESKLVPKRSDTQSPTLFSAGIYLGTDFVLPFSNPLWNQILGFKLYPVLNHREGPSVSGSHTRSVAWSAETRWGFQMDERRSAFLRIEYESERNQFSSLSSVSDPIRSIFIDSVSAQRNSWNFGFGFEWKK
jgi:hypothetical protein